MNTIGSNIWKLSVIRIIRWFMLFMPVIVLFYQENGLSMSQVLVIQSIFSIAIVIFEVPSGYFADVSGRKNSIVIGSFLVFGGFVVYAASYGFWGFLIAELILGLGSSFISGSDSAMLYDTLADLNREAEYMKLEGRLLSMASLSEGIASIIGGFLAVISLRTPLLAEAALLVITLPLALTLIEPKRQKLDASEGNLKVILNVITFSLKDRPDIRWLIIYSSVIASATLTMVWFIQPYLAAAGLPLSWFGIVWAGLQFSVAYFTLTAHRIEKFVGSGRAMLVLLILIFFGYSMTAQFQTIWGALFLLTFYFARGLANPIFRTYINQRISSDIRATVLSLRNLVGRFIFSAVGPVIGWVNDEYSLAAALGTAGIVFTAFGGISLGFLYKNRGMKTVIRSTR
jgi:MFS family permease